MCSCCEYELFFFFRIANRVLQFYREFLFTNGVFQVICTILHFIYIYWFKKELEYASIGFVICFSFIIWIVQVVFSGNKNFCLACRRKYFSSKPNIFLFCFKIVEFIMFLQHFLFFFVISTKNHLERDFSKHDSFSTPWKKVVINNWLTQSYAFAMSFVKYLKIIVFS